MPEPTKDQSKRILDKAKDVHVTATQDREWEIAAGAKATARTAAERIRAQNVEKP